MLKLGNRTFYRETLRLGLPIAVQGLLTSSLSFIDSLMVGSLGETALAAVGAAGQFGSLLFGFYWGICCGGTIFIAQYHGVHDETGIRRAHGLTTTCMMALTLLFSLLAVCAPYQVMGIYAQDAAVREMGVEYLRIIGVAYLFQTMSAAFSNVLGSTERVKIPLVASLASITTNTLLNWILIYGKLGVQPMGVRGAAIASLAAAVVNLAVLMGVCFYQRNVAVTGWKQMFLWPRSFVAEYVAKCTPLVINEVGYSLAILVVNIVFGRQGEASLAAVSIFRTIEGLLYAFFRGFANASSVMVGKRVGAGELKDAAQQAVWFTILCPMLSFALCVAVLALRTPLLGLFDISDSVRSTVVLMLLAFAILGPMRHMNYIQNNIYRAGGESRVGTFIELGAIWLVTVPLVLLTGLVFHAPFVVVFIASMFEEFVKLPIELKYLLSRRWIKPVTEQGRAALAENA